MPPRSFDLPLGGTPGADHADPGVCKYHPSVMLAPDEKCQVCMQNDDTTAGGNFILAVNGTREIRDILAPLRRGHAAAGHYV